MHQYYLMSLWFLILTLNLTEATVSRKDILRQSKFPPCKACKVFTESFQRGVDETSKGFEGGDAAWEEEKLGSYARSEVRLVEIQEKVCSDVEEGKAQCYALHEEYDSDIEDWWLNHQDNVDLFKYFCIDKLKHCCPDLHYGPNCLPCPGYPDYVCSKNGKCKGSGTRKGNGTCACDKGYIGKLCDSCDGKHFESYRDKQQVLCSPCPLSCDGPCSKTSCEKCAPGWSKNEDGVCLDINECASTKPACGPLQFCVNNEGSFKCLECDKSCAGCTGDGPDMCTECATGYTHNGNMCVDNGQETKYQHMFYSRILTYIGLCIATCITYQKNVVVAGIIGVSVAVYIAISEYMLNASSPANATDIVEKLLLHT